MAYLQSSVVRTRYTYGEKKYILCTFTETGGTTTGEWTIPELPRLVTLVKYKSTLTAGTGTSINPKLGRVTAWVSSTQDDIGTNTATAAHINDQTIVRIILGPSGALFGRSQPSAGTDNAIAVEICFVEGHIL